MGSCQPPGLSLACKCHHTSAEIESACSSKPPVFLSARHNPVNVGVGAAWWISSFSSNMISLLKVRVVFSCPQGKVKENCWGILIASYHKYSVLTWAEKTNFSEGVCTSQIWMQKDNMGLKWAFIICMCALTLAILAESEACSSPTRQHSPALGFANGASRALPCPADTSRGVS